MTSHWMIYLRITFSLCIVGLCSIWILKLPRRDLKIKGFTQSTNALILILFAFLILGLIIAIDGFKEIPAIVFAVLGCVMWTFLSLSLFLIITCQNNEIINPVNRNVQFYLLNLLIFCIVLSGFIILGALKNWPNIVTTEEYGQWQPIKSVNDYFVFDDYNFRFKAPSKDWGQFNPHLTEPHSLLGFSQTHPVRAVMITAVNKDVRKTVTTEQMIKNVLSTVNTEHPDSHIISQPEPYKVAGLSGQKICFENTQGHKTFQYISWSVIYKGFLFMITAWAEKSSTNTYLQVFKEMADRFEVIDMNREVPMFDDQGASLFHSRLFPYAVQQDGRWLKWEQLNNQIFPAEFGLLNSESNAVFVIPVFFPIDPPTGELFSQTIMQLFNNLNNNSLPELMRPIQEKRWKGYIVQLKVKANDNREVLYKFKFLIKDNIGLAIGALGYQSQFLKSTAMLDYALEMAKIDDQIQTIQPKDFNESEKKRQAFIYELLGKTFAEHAQAAPAIDYLKQAFQWEPSQSVYLENLTGTLIQLKRYEEAFKLLKENIAHFQEHLSLMALLAICEKHLGFHYESIKHFERVFNKGFEQDDIFREYIDLLVQEKNLKPALHEAKNYVKRTNTFSANFILANVYEKMGRLGDENEILKKLYEKFPFNNNIANKYINFLIKAHQSEEALKIADKILVESGSSSMLYFYRGSAFYQMKRYKEAEENLRSAVDLDPDFSDAQDLLEEVEQQNEMKNLESKSTKTS